MGNKIFKNKQKAPQVPPESTVRMPRPVDKNRLDIILKEIYFGAQLAKDKRKGAQTMKERELMVMITQTVTQRNYESEYQKASAIVNDTRTIKALEYVMKYAEILKDYQSILTFSQGNVSRVHELFPYVDSIFFAGVRTNLDYMNEFRDVLMDLYGEEGFYEMTSGKGVFREVADLFSTVLPLEDDVKAYLLELCKKNGFDIKSMNEVGHGLIDERRPKRGPGGGFGSGDPFDYAPKFGVSPFTKTGDEDSGQPDSQISPNDRMDKPQIKPKVYPTFGDQTPGNPNDQFSEFDRRMSEIRKGL